MDSKNYSLAEMLVANLAKELEDEEVGFIGLGTGGKTFILAVGVPTVASKLAQLTHAPDFVPMLGPIVDPDLAHIPESYTDHELLSWPCRAQISVMDCLDYWQRGMINVGFVSGAQVDMYGNVNTVSIGNYENPKVRLVGPIAQTNHMAFGDRVFIFQEHEKRSFVEKVDFISGTGFLDGGDAREKAGLRGNGPSKVFTDLAILDFCPDTKRMRLVSVHPGVTVEQVQENTGFELIIPDHVSVTPEPTDEELKLIRQIDPKGLLLEAKIK
jgi:glutaconate CoA-transferase, subunit B